MNKIIPLIVVLIFCNCKSKNEFEGHFLSAIEITSLNWEGKSIDFNVGYKVEFGPTKTQQCLVDTKEELNKQFIQPTIRDVVREYVGQLDSSETLEIDAEKLRAKINEEFAEYNNSLNTSILVNCQLSISMFAIKMKDLNLVN